MATTSHNYLQFGDKAVLKKYLAGTKFIPTDGIVRKQALEVTKGASTDVDKARAVVGWWPAQFATDDERLAMLRYGIDDLDRAIEAFAKVGRELGVIQ